VPEALEAIDPMYSGDWVAWHCDGTWLNEVLPRFANLTAVTATSSNPFEGLPEYNEQAMAELKRCWKHVPGYPGVRDWHREGLWQNQDMSHERYSNIIDAAQLTQRPVTKLVFDPWPYSCFWLKGLEVQPFFMGLHELRLGIVADLTSEDRKK
jgi:hypothetical protein